MEHAVPPPCIGFQPTDGALAMSRQLIDGRKEAERETGADARVANMR
ncbi:MAG TPA: hypothetical protein VGO47_14370 [Chlamydiales bacterium]|nr:hypothetical protein [Chlamydiales bacterium]